ncbi:hypothetical protein QWZ08_07580 [Ferruginibacter paludis]|uniref:hypothetical protein n=1 Tax=Ferruginibacter paludis TaxID=1310417 RepID=UPI0025B42B0B|nr:hypothetical protein [Ferruginibacter paludis]MDN3655480.1 hypothetical protein [Ferruginibacter paludis]
MKKILKTGLLGCILAIGMAACTNGTSANTRNGDTTIGTNSNKMDTSMHDTSMNKMSTDTGSMRR